MELSRRVQVQGVHGHRGHPLPAQVNTHWRFSTRSGSPCSSSVMPEPLLGVRSDDQGRPETITPNDEPALPALCARVHARVAAFLAAEATTERLRKVQDQTRLSLKIIDEALDRYR